MTYTTKDGTAHEFDALEFLAALSAHIPKTYESLSPGTMDATTVGADVKAPKLPLLPLKNRRATIGKSSVRAVGPRA